MRKTHPFTALVAIVSLSILLCAFLLEAVKQPEIEPAKNNSSQAQQPAGQAAISGMVHEKEISRSNFKGQWPLVVDRATLICSGQPPMISVRTTAGTFSVNGTAQTHSGFPPIDAIWLIDESNPPSRISISPLIAEGFSLCRPDE